MAVSPWPAPLTFKQEVVVESMVLPTEVKFGEPFQAKVVAWSQADTQGRLSLFRNGEFLGSQVVRLAAGKNVYTYRQSLEQSGIHVYQAHLDVEGDTIEENNRALGTIVVRGRPLVLVAEKDRSQGQSLAVEAFVKAQRGRKYDNDLPAHVLRVDVSPAELRAALTGIGLQPLANRRIG